MRLLNGQIHLSATDLGRHLACRHLTQLDRAAAEGRLAAPHWEDPILDALRERGLRHETAHEEHLRAKGLNVVRLTDRNDTDAPIALMRQGADVIAQAPLSDGHFGGIADFLHKVLHPTDLGDYAYEVTDTKLALDTRAGTVLQLALYSELVGQIQGAAPEHMHVVKPGEPFDRETFRCADVAAYYRLVKRRLAAVVAAPPDDTTYPNPVPHCDVCRWWRQCDNRRRADDHLCLVAGMSTLHTAEFHRQGVTTLEQLGDAAVALPARPDRGGEAAFERLREQARIQLSGRRAGRLLHELLPLDAERGLLRLPEPSPGDVFFDIEAARFYDVGGLEYLFGWCGRGDAGGLAYHRRWARDRVEERRALEEFIAVVMERWDRHDGMHVYHFAPYEPSALKRLIGRYGSCETELDRLLRGGRLVDLHAVARQGVRASVEHYSLKDLEKLAGFERAVDLREAARARRRIEAALEVGQVEGLAPADRDTVEGYNREDCEATAALRDWLEARRQEWIDRGTPVPRPELRAGDASESVAERTAEVQAVYDALLCGLPADRFTWTDEHEAVGLLAEMLNYYRREMNCSHWEFFRVHELEFADLLDERTAIAGLEFVETVEVTRRIPIDRYRYPEQEVSVDVGDRLFPVGDTLEDLGNVVGVDTAARTVDIKKRKRSAAVHPYLVMVDGRVEPGAKVGSLLAFARSVAEQGIDGNGPFRAGRDLLLKRPPRRRGTPGGPVRAPGEELLSAATRLADELDRGVLPIQGPPGSGKTYTGARMIVALAARGLRIGVTAVGHKVIQKLLDEVHEAAREAGLTIRSAHKDGTGAIPAESAVAGAGSNDAALAALAEGSVVGGTAWLWARDEAVERLDYLFVDEAGQMAVADVLAVSRATRNIVLLGDPQQLEHPNQAAHPEGTDAAALVHLLEERKTLTPEKGLFLDKTWRLHPSVCGFTSKLYYENRLGPQVGNDRQSLGGPTRFAGAGLHLVTVDHVGNQSVAPEEVDLIGRIVRDLLQDGVTWTDRVGKTGPLAPDDVLIVAPYNAQIGALKRALPDMRIGTVDRFQGQEAPVVIYSTTSSSPEDAPRGMRFLYNPNRLNVATSRARGVVIVVASPRLFEPECRTPDQMRWANGLCAYREMATGIEF
jgi:uncharacterized protein